MRNRFCLPTRHAICVTGFFCLFFTATSFNSIAQPKWDVDVFRSINNSRSNFQDATVGANDYSVLPIAVATPLIFGSVGLAEKDGYTFDTGVMVGVTEVSAYAIYYILKNVVVKRDRPYGTLSDVHTMHLDTADKYSMPSGHTTAAFAIATALTFRYPKPYVYIPAYAWAVFVGYGRIYMGLHYPSDVLAGAILGSASAFAIHLISPQLTKWRQRILGDDLGVQLTASPVPTLVNLKVSF
ncbi:MAG TPA: phosphatase PAP2 family protein [Candidatus Acidoferrales bacterium]|nr:phosphatase PAP2 family protein [Candidatus Acidoferrales bacterium]